TGGAALSNPRAEPAARIIYANDKTQSTPMFSVVVPESEDREDRAVNVLYQDRSGTIWCGTMRHPYRLARNELVRKYETPLPPGTARQSLQTLARGCGNGRREANRGLYI